VRLFSQDAKVKALRRAPLFADLSQKELAQLARVTEDIEVDAGRVLIREGDRGDEFFVLMDGTVRVKRKGKDLGTRSAPDILGEISIVEQVPRTATVTAETPVRFFVLTSRAFRSLVKESPNVELKVLRTLAQRVRDMSDDPCL
jgi:CRP/FNR family transcriptional regulator, cyclic AMP receptor protein